MRVLVTGNLGYVGTIMTPLLKAEGHDIFGYDTGYYEPCVLGELGPAGLDRQITGDIRNIEVTDLENIDVVVHLAALSNDPVGELNPQLTEDINTKASLRLANAAKRAGVSRFIFASSCSIYGQGAGGALTEEAAFNPLTAYARSKVDTEEGLRALADDRFSPVLLRNGTAYGFSPRLRFDIVVNNLTGWAVTTGKVKLLSDGRAWRPMVHVEDMGRAVAAAIVADRDRIHNQAFNVGREEDNHQIREMAESIAQVVPNCEVTFAEGASADNRNYNVSFEKIRRHLPEFEARWNVEKGARQLYDAFSRVGLTFEQFDGNDFTRLKQLQHLVNSKRLDDNLLWTTKAAR